MFSVIEDESHIPGGRSRVEYTTRFTHGRVRYSVIFGGNPAQRLPQPVTLRIITEKIQKQMKTQVKYKLPKEEEHRLVV